MKWSEKVLERELKALANRRRLAIVSFVKKRREATVGEIAEAINLSFTATSKHLLMLTAANILDREQRSLMVFYRLADNPNEIPRAIIAQL